MTNLPRLIEPLESRIAPAGVSIINPIFDITATPGQTGASIDLGKMLDASKTYRTTVEFITNYIPPGQTEFGKIQIELFDDKAPLTVANFLRYINNPDKAADFDGIIFSRLVQGFVLQGGGINASDFPSHINTFPSVHNEFDPNDPERSNLIQTVAMAKVAAESGGGANSATSEFFINLNNNAANLDHQNGGFTVFGRVTDASMPVVTAISQLHVFSSSVPVQNSDGTSFPSESQLITITDAHVVSSGLGDSGDATFSIESITDATSGLPTKLVTAKLNPTTHQLDLKYAPNASGQVKIKVNVSEGGDTTTDEFVVTVLPNLITQGISDGLKSTLVPGDTGTAKILVANNGGALAKGNVKVNLYLSKSKMETDDGGNPIDPQGFDFDPNVDVPLGFLSIPNFSLASGKTKAVSINYKIPATDKLIDGEQYRLLAVIETPDGTKHIQELFSGAEDNKATFTKASSLTAPTILHKFALAFGAVDGRGNVPVTVKDGAEHDITLKLTGPGTGAVTKNADGTIDISLSGTTAASSLKIVTGKGLVAEIDDLFINDTIGSVSLANTHLHGHFTASGGAKTITFGDLGNTGDPVNDIDKTLSIGAFPVATQKLSLKLGEVHDYSLLSNMPISSLTAKTWVNDELLTAADNIGASSIGTLKIAGDLEANVTLVESTKLSVFSVGGTLHSSTVRVAGDVGAVSVGNLDASTFLAGLAARPDDLGDFVAGKTISSFTVKGTMADSIVAAAKIGTASVAAVDGNTGTELRGFYADAIKTYIRKGVVKLTNLDAASVVDTVLPHYEVRLF